MKRKKIIKVAWALMSVIIMLSMLVWTFGSMLY